MIRELGKHKLAYLILILGLIAGVVLFLGAWPDRFLQRAIALSLAGFYFIWGVLTHFKARRITRQVIFEYLGVSILAGLLLFLVTL